MKGRVIFIKKFICYLILILLYSQCFYGCTIQQNNGLGPRGDFSIKINENYKFARINSRDMSIFNTKKHSLIIQPKVIELGWDEKFIIAKQTYVDINIQSHNEEKLQLPSKGENYYWIIKLETDTVYGPFKDKETFDKNKELLKVSKDIKLKDVYSYDNKE